MNRNFVRPMRLPRHQRGVGVLLIAIVLLGIVTVMTLFSLSAGLYEQRTAANESRYRLAYQTAQAGMDQGLEFIKSNTSNAVSCWLWPGLNSCTTAGESRRWSRCSATDQTSPCGAIEAGVASSTLRANYFYYNDANNRGTDDPKTLNFALSPVTGATNNQAVATMGNFSVNYQVNALLCLIDTATPSNQCLTDNEFTTTYGSTAVPSSGANSVGYGANTFSSNGLFAVTLVSRSQLAAQGGTDNEGAQAVLKATVATYRIIGTAPDVPLVASSSVTGLGNAEIVANPNAGGTGVALSIWSAACIHVTKNDPCGGNSDASFATCQVDEFFKTGGSNTGTCSSGPSTGAPCQYDGSTTCGGGGNACSCSKIAQLVGNNGSPYGLGAISGHYGTNTVAGPDLLGVNVGGPIPDAQFFPLHVQNSYGDYLNNPPNQLDNTPFEYAFSTHVADSNSVMLDADGNGIDDATDFLKSHFTDITDTGGCAGLTANSHGFLFTRKGVACSLPNTQVGTPIRPVTLVVQGDLTFASGTTFFGFIFVRSSAGIGESVVTANTYDVKAAGSPQLYGAMVIEGAPKIAGSPQLIYDANTLNNIINGPDNTRMGFLPGSWSDAGRIDVTSKAYTE